MKNIFSKSNLKFTLFITVFTLIALEIFGRVYLTKVLHKSTSPKFEFDSYRIYKHIAGFKEGADGKNWIEINNQGFRRSTDVKEEKPADTYRVFLMGGSAAHGISSTTPYPVVHIYMNETIDAYLEQMLKQKYPGKKIEIINAAVTGYQVFQHTPYILYELLDYHPDLVVFFDGTNDHYFNNANYNQYSLNRYQFWKERLQQPTVSGMFDYFFLWLAKYSAFARGYFAWRLNSDAQKYDHGNVAQIPYKSKEELYKNHRIVAKKQFLRSIETNINILHANGIQSLICLQPMLVLRDRNNLSAEEKKWLHRDQTCVDLYPLVLQELKELTSKYNTAFIDMNVPFNDAKYKNHQLLIDYCHLSPEGGKLTASVMFPVVDSLMQSGFNNQK